MQTKFSTFWVFSTLDGSFSLDEFVLRFKNLFESYAPIAPSSMCF